MVGWNYAPNGWALCNGQLMSISQNSALFSLLGTSYGGDGRQTFALPNLQSRVPVHQGQGLGLSPYVMGQIGGNEAITLLNNHVPIHNHLLNVTGAQGTVSSPINAIPAEAPPLSRGANPPTNYAPANAASGTMAPNAISFAGGGQPHDNIQPYLCVNFIIALVGIFPSRG